jgi:hypothetical protein
MVMDKRSLIQFYLRGIVQQVVAAIKQLPPHLQVRVDVDRLLQSFEYGDLYNPSKPAFWDTAPGWRQKPIPDTNSVVLEDNHAVRMLALATLLAYEKKHNTQVLTTATASGNDTSNINRLGRSQYGKSYTIKSFF